MKTRQCMLTASLATLLFAAGGAAQAPAQQPPIQQQTPGQSIWAAPAQAGQSSTGVCGSQPMCYDAQDFAVAVVDFRMSLASGYKVMDATLRFVNKTNQPLILGYLDGSAIALDDQGNRYNPYGNRNLAGIGIVSGNSGDPKFVLQPGGAGDARWELIWRPGPQDPVGSTFDLGMTIREMNTLVGGAHTLGAEVPLRFQGLANGMTGASGAAGYAGAATTPGAAGTASPMLATGATSGLPPCGPNATGTLSNVAGAANTLGGQQTAAATSTATNTATGAAAALSNLKSLFGKKNTATPATNVAGAAPCVPAAPSAATPVAAGTSIAPAAAGTTPTPAANAKTPVAAAAKSATPGAAGPTAATAPKTAAPNANAARTPPATAPNAPNAAKPAVVTTAAPATKPTAKPATQPAPAKKPAPSPNTTTTANPPPKPPSQ